MDSKAQYEKSLAEIKRLKKGVGSQTLNIKFDQLDGITAGKLRTAIITTLTNRESSVAETITGIDTGSWG